MRNRKAIICVKQHGQDAQFVKEATAIRLYNIRLDEQIKAMTPVSAEALIEFNSWGDKWTHDAYIRSYLAHYVSLGKAGLCFDIEFIRDDKIKNKAFRCNEVYVDHVYGAGFVEDIDLVPLDNNVYSFELPTELLMILPYDLEYDIVFFGSNRDESIEAMIYKQLYAILPIENMRIVEVQ